MFGGYTAQNAPVHETFAADRIGWRQIDVWRFLQKRNFQMKLFGHTLRRWMRIAWPHNVTDIELLRSPWFPYANLIAGKFWIKIIHFLWKIIESVKIYYSFTSSHTKFLLLMFGRKFIIFNSADFKSPSAVNSIFARFSVSIETLRRWRKNLNEATQTLNQLQFVFVYCIVDWALCGVYLLTLRLCPIAIFPLVRNSNDVYSDCGRPMVDRPWNFARPTHTPSTRWQFRWSTMR